MVRMGGFFPWSAWDISRAFAVSLTLVCSWLWIRRITQSKSGAFLGSILIAFGMGTRWILGLLPLSWVANIASNIYLIGSSADTAKTLADAISRSWVIEGAPPVPIPYAFANGILNPLTFDWGGASSLPLLALILILMLFRHVETKMERPLVIRICLSVFGFKRGTYIHLAGFRHWTCGSYHDSSPPIVFAASHIFFLGTSDYGDHRYYGA